MNEPRHPITDVIDSANRIISIAKTTNFDSYEQELMKIALLDIVVDLMTDICISLFRERPVPFSWSDRSLGTVEANIPNMLRKHGADETKRYLTQLILCDDGESIEKLRDLVNS